MQTQGIFSKLLKLNRAFKLIKLSLPNERELLPFP
jgi:hypothetical protein